MINIIDESKTIPLPEVPKEIEGVKKMYEETFERLIIFVDMPLTADTCTAFDAEVARIVHRHRYVVEKMALGILEFKESLEAKELMAAEDKIHYFLDRFFMNRFAANVLCHQHCNLQQYLTDTSFIFSTTRCLVRKQTISIRTQMFSNGQHHRTARSNGQKNTKRMSRILQENTTV